MKHATMKEKNDHIKEVDSFNTMNANALKEDFPLLLQAKVPKLTTIHGSADLSLACRPKTSASSYDTLCDSPIDSCEHIALVYL